MSEQRRRHPRFRDTVMITFETVPGEDSAGDMLNEIPCWLKELSEGGAMLQTPKEIAPSTPLLLHVNLPLDGGGEQYLEIRGEVRWQKEASKGGPWFIGVQFRRVSDADRAALKSYIELRFSKPSFDTNQAMFD